MAELRAAYSEFISLQPGFVGAALHVNDARTRVANYSQWRNRDDFKDMLKTDEMRERNQRINALCRGFEPVMYEVFATHETEGRADRAMTDDADRDPRMDPAGRAAEPRGRSAALRQELTFLREHRCSCSTNPCRACCCSGSPRVWPWVWAR
jgi:heme-degrading monooxygenase HmoA